MQEKEGQTQYKKDVYSDTEYIRAKTHSKMYRYDDPCTTDQANSEENNLNSAFEQDQQQSLNTNLS